MPSLNWLLNGGNIMALLCVMGVLLKVNARLNRDESLKKDYPPHRHINGTRIVYPQEYQPSPIERFGSD